MNLAYNGYKSFDICNLCDPELKSHLRNYQEIKYRFEVEIHYFDILAFQIQI